MTTREIELTEVERLAWEGLLREQAETASYLGELKSFLRATFAAHAAHPRVVADLRALGDDLHEKQTTHAVELSNATADAHDFPRPRASPRMIPHDPENGLRARLVWLEADPTLGAKPAPVASDCPVVPAAPAP